MNLIKTKCKVLPSFTLWGEGWKSFSNWTPDLLSNEVAVFSAGGSLIRSQRSERSTYMVKWLEVVFFVCFFCFSFPESMSWGIDRQRDVATSQSDRMLALVKCLWHTAHNKVMVYFLRLSALLAFILQKNKKKNQKKKHTAQVHANVNFSIFTQVSK